MKLHYIHDQNPLMKKIIFLLFFTTGLLVDTIAQDIEVIDANLNPPKMRPAKRNPNRLVL